MSIAPVSDNYLRYNEISSKNLMVAVEIPGVDLLSTGQLFTRLRYGDPGEFYGGPDNPIYGGLRHLGSRQILSLDGSSLTISQKLEPEQGRASISTLSLAFIDVGPEYYMTQVVSPGVIIPEILGREVTVRLGYQQLSYPEDYFVIFKGVVSTVQAKPGLIVLQFSDGNIKRRQAIFATNGIMSSTAGLVSDSGKKALLVGNILDSDTTINVTDNSLFYKPILGPDGTYDIGRPWNPDGTYNPIQTKTTGARVFFKIDDEWIEYGPLGYGPNTFTNVLRGARGTIAADHQSGAEVAPAIEIEDHGIDMALKLMLSGWNGVWATNIPLFSIVRTFDAILLDQPSAIILPDKKDAQVDYGLVAGDWITITGASNLSNNGTFQISHFDDLFLEPNRIIYIIGTLTEEYPTSAVMSLRSQFDTYPIVAGNKLKPNDVDVQAHIDLKDTFLADSENAYRFFITSPEGSCKRFIESEIYLPMSAYSLTKRGLLSVGYTRPPLASDNMLVLNWDNVLNAESVTPTRSISMNRKFFNEIDWQFDEDDNGTFVTTSYFLDIDSLSLIGVLSILPITSRGLRTSLGANDLLSRRSNFLLSRYKRAATTISVVVNWEVGNQIEAGDTIALQDNVDSIARLQISNFNTGERDLGAQLYEVIDRSLDIKDGKSTLNLVSGLGADITDRYATISPSSLIVSGSNDHLIIKDSFGVLYPGNESRKWRDYIGLPIVVHDEDYTYYQKTNLLGIDPSNNYKLLIDGFSVLPGSFTNLIIDIPNYPLDVSKTVESLYKACHAFWGHQVSVTSGASQTQFDVSDITYFFIGGRLVVHKDDYSSTSSPTEDVDRKIIDIVGNTITVDKPMGFTPDNTYLVDCTGFPDKTGWYRFI